MTGFDQETFAAMCGLSTKALYQIDKDKGHPPIGTLDAILRKFGLRAGLTVATKTAQTPTLGQNPPASKTPARGSNPQRQYAGQLSRTVTLRAAAKPKTKKGDPSPNE
ncbi:helix-turn-helix domain-containing protein [Pseudomonas sp. Q1-7]|uniref:helix-turn-helix domain-containing protein n=1 Tax=Pseudomonas sp. Q1-7 TaxID=3020843 RepID=UPI0022FFFB1F|nr:XRE family transcriptional regulator [Pseudomonas sp. Q1-7]